MNDVKLSDLTPRPVRASPPVDKAASVQLAKEPSSEAVSTGGASSVQGADKAETISASGDPQQGSQESTQQAKEAVTKLNEYVQSVQRDLQFNLDDSSGKTVIQVLERSTQEVIRQIPDEVAIKLAHNLQSDEPLSLFNAKA